MLTKNYRSPMILRTVYLFYMITMIVIRPDSEIVLIIRCIVSIIYNRLSAANYQLFIIFLSFLRLWFHADRFNKTEVMTKHFQNFYQKQI